MFHMSREIYDKIEELGRLIAGSPEFAAVKQAEAEGQKNPQLTGFVAQYAGKQKLLEDEILKDDKDFDKIGALTRELDEISEQMHAIPAYAAMRQARDEFDALMQGVNDVLRSVVEPDVQCSCRGNCAECGGCGQS